MEIASIYPSYFPLLRASQRSVIGGYTILLSLAARPFQTRDEKLILSLMNHDMCKD